VNKKWFLTIQLIFILNVSLFLLPTKLVQASNSTYPFEINHRLVINEVTNKSYIYIMGEMINNLDVPITNVSFKITFYDHDQREIKTVNATCWSEDILPQRRTAFSTGYVEKQLVEGFANYIVEVEHYEECSGKPLGLAITQAQVIVSNSSVAVDGYLMNNGSETTMFIDVTAFYYGIDGFLAVSGLPMALQSEGGITPKNTCEFRIPPCPYVNETNFVKCILTAESYTKGVYAGYAIEKEITIEWNKEGSQYNPNYDWVFVLFMTICAVIIVMFVLKRRKKKRKSHHTKTKD